MVNDTDQQTDGLWEITKRFEQNLKLGSPKRDNLENKMELAKPVILGTTGKTKTRASSPRPRGIVTQSAVYVTSPGIATANTTKNPENFPNHATPNQEPKKMKKISEKSSPNQAKNLSWKSKNWDTTVKQSKPKTVYLKTK